MDDGEDDSTHTATSVAVSLRSPHRPGAIRPEDNFCACGHGWGARTPRRGDLRGERTCLPLRSEDHVADRAGHDHGEVLHNCEALRAQVFWVLLQAAFWRGGEAAGGTGFRRKGCRPSRLQHAGAGGAIEKARFAIRGQVCKRKRRSLSVSLSLSLSVSLSLLSLSLSLRVCLCLCQSVSLFVCLHVCLYVCLSVFLSLSLSLFGGRWRVAGRIAPHPGFAEYTCRSLFVAEAGD